MTQFLTRATLSRHPSIAAMARQLLPEENGERAYAAHRLVWSLFAGDETRKRDFLFREVDPAMSTNRGRAAFMVLSAQRPSPDHPFFEVETKPFEPTLQKGQRLRFSLRANPVRQAPHQAKHKRRDVVMHALHGVPVGERAAARPLAIQEAGFSWLEGQGERNGFRLPTPEDEDEPTLRIDGYEQWRIPRLGRQGVVSVLEFDGELEVTDPEAFLSRLAVGFGRARSFGCGLMLIRRA